MKEDWVVRGGNLDGISEYCSQYVGIEGIRPKAIRPAETLLYSGVFSAETTSGVEFSKKTEQSKDENRLLLDFHYKLRVNASRACRRIYKTHSEKTCGVGTAQRFETFRKERDRLTDRPREGFPREVGRQGVVN
ncbi:hypothetical protein KIN20_007695 [Parelaphostrongylus tenuis]|uniref:Uncharacterized protein n=1 Tax=Parelaphostrongylus tenuis TaxID=148309 RepID=A0AAD5QK62_PARTN|nr:hypothetical protein KIN20_007695 [Parelaphostrongylus tenuis]